MKISLGEIIGKLNLKPLPGEGGYYSETYKSKSIFKTGQLPANFKGEHAFSTCIYYLITTDSFSQMHRLPADEIWHFYLGDPAYQLQLYPDGKGKKLSIGCNLNANEQPQVIVPANVWQGTKLKKGGEYALFGTTMSPGFEFLDYEAANAKDLIDKYPAFKNEIMELI